MSGVYSLEGPLSWRLSNYVRSHFFVESYLFCLVKFFRYVYTISAFGWDATVWREASPINYVTSAAPPFIVLRSAAPPPPPLCLPAVPLPAPLAETTWGLYKMRDALLGELAGSCRLSMRFQPASPRKCTLRVHRCAWRRPRGARLCRRQSTAYRALPFASRSWRLPTRSGRSSLAKQWILLPVQSDMLVK